MAVRVLLIDDNPQFLLAAQSLLEREGMTVVATASSSADALERAAELQPDVALVDIDLGSENGFDLADRLGRIDGEHRPAVILISTYAAQDLADLIEASAAVGFVSKSDLSAEAIAELLARAAGDS